MLLAKTGDISMALKLRELLGCRCFFSIICGQFSYRHCWETLRADAFVKSAAPSGSSRLHNITKLS